MPVEATHAFAAAASSSPSTATPPLPREISARDVRDLALAVVEGAVAAEALAKELKRSPDRSRHFADIAERLRAVVGRASIRSALVDDAPHASLALTGPRPGSVVAPLPAPMSPPPSLQPPHQPSIQSSLQPSLVSALPSAPPPLPAPAPAPKPDEIARAVVGLMHADEMATRLARLEHLLAASVQHLDETVRQAMAKTSAGERTVVTTAAEAIAVAQKLVDRVAARGPVVVRIE